MKLEFDQRVPRKLGKMHLFSNQTSLTKFKMRYTNVRTNLFWFLIFSVPLKKNVKKIKKRNSKYFKNRFKCNLKQVLIYFKLRNDKLNNIWYSVLYYVYFKYFTR